MGGGSRGEKVALERLLPKIGKRSEALREIK